MSGKEKETQHEIPSTNFSDAQASEEKVPTKNDQKMSLYAILTAPTRPSDEEEGGWGCIDLDKTELPGSA